MLYEFTFIFYDLFHFFLYPFSIHTEAFQTEITGNGFSTRTFLAKHPTFVAGKVGLQRRDHATLKGNGWLVDKVNIDTLFK